MSDNKSVPIPNGWNEYQKLVLSKLEEHDKHFENIYKAQNAIRIDIATLKVKAGVWGAIAGLIPTSCVLIYWILKGG